MGPGVNLQLRVIYQAHNMETPLAGYCMVIRGRGNRLPIEVWETESLRLTVFPTPASPVEDVGWWESLMGEQPEVEVVRPRQGGRRIEGAFEGGRLIMQVAPARIDLQLIPSPGQEATTTGFFTIGKFTAIVGPFAQVASRWLDLDSFPEIQRIAFGAILLFPTDSRASGYRQLAAYLPSVNIDPDHATDLFYQINRARDSATGISNLRINRLSKWSVVLMSAGGLVIEPTQILYQEVPRQYFACRLEVDINTAPGRREPLPRETLPSIFGELMELGREIVREGDIP